MAEEEIKFITMADNLYQSGQIEDAKAMLLNGLELYPDNIAMQDLLQQYQDTKDFIVHDDIQRENKETKQCKHQNETEDFQQSGSDSIEHNIGEIKEKQNLSIYISLQMRLKVLIMELNAVKMYSLKKLIGNENDTWEKINAIETCKSIVYTALEFNNFEKAEDELLKAESLSTQLSRKIKKVINKKHVNKEKVKKPEHDIQVPDYRSTVTIRGDEIDVKNCILKAKKALDNSNYDKAEELLLKAERIIPTKNARDLLRSLQASKELKQNSELIEKGSETEEQGNAVTLEDSKLEEDITNAAKSLRAFENAFNTGKFEKAERMLNMAKRLNPSLYVEEKMSRLNVAKSNKIMEEKQKEEIEKAKRECKTPGECLYNAMKACGAGDFVNAEFFLCRAKAFAPTLNLEPELSTINTKMASKSSEGDKNKDKTEYQESVTENNVKCAAACLYNAKKAYDTGDYQEAERYLNDAITFDPFLELESYLSKCKTEAATMISKEGNLVILESVYKEEEVVEKGISNKNDNPKINKTIEYQGNSLKNKTTNKQAKIDADGHKYSKDNKTNSNTKPLPKMDQVVKKNITMAEKAIRDNKLDDAIKFLNTAEELYSTERANELLKNIGEMLISREEKYEYFNCYEFPLEPNESHKAEAFKCVKLAQLAFKDRQYDKAEHFLTKSLRICDTPLAKSFLETVVEAKAQYSNNVTVGVENVNDTTNAYNKCIDLTTKAITDGSLTTAERLLSKAIATNPKNDDQMLLKHIQDVRALQASYDGAITSNPLKSDYDLNRERVAEMYVNLAVDEITRGTFYVAHRYLERALEKQPNEQTRELLRYVQTYCLNQHKPRTKYDIKFQANRLLDRAEYFIYFGNFEKAESLLIISWAMDTSQRTTLVHKKLLKTRLALFRGNKDNKSDGNSENIFESDKLVELALNKYEDKKNEEAEKLLTRALQFYPSVRINKLLVEIGKDKNKDSNYLTKAYNYVSKKLS